MENNIVLNRIKKLLALSSSPNENEASAALEKIQELLKEYNLSMREVESFDGDKPNKYEVISGDKLPKWKQQLIATLAKVFNCIALNERSLSTGYKRIMFFFGKEVDALTASNTFDYLSNVIEREASKLKGKGAKFINSYKLGMYVRIAERLREKHEQQTTYGNGEYGLIVINNKRMLNRELSKLGSYGNSKVRGSYSDSSGLKAGMSKGESIGLDPQVSRSNNNLYLS